VGMICSRPSPKRPVAYTPEGLLGGNYFILRSRFPYLFESFALSFVFPSLLNTSLLLDVFPNPIFSYLSSPAPHRLPLHHEDTSLRPLSVFLH